MINGQGENPVVKCNKKVVLADNCNWESIEDGNGRNWSMWK